MNPFSFLVNRLRKARFAVQRRTSHSLLFGTIYKVSLYKNWKHDTSPLIFIMYSGHMTFVRKSGHYTDGINLNYLQNSDKIWLARMIYLMKKGNQKMNGAVFYKYIKARRPSIIRTAYRRYHTALLTQPKLVSAGMTNLYKLVYPSNDPFIKQLNEQISFSSLNKTNIQVAYNPTELRDRIIEAQNSRSITSTTAPPQRVAPWLKKV